MDLMVAATAILSILLGLGVGAGVAIAILFVLWYVENKK